MKSVNKGVAEHKLGEFVPAVEGKIFPYYNEVYWVGVLGDHNRKPSASTIHRSLVLQRTGLEKNAIPPLPPCLFTNYYFNTKVYFIYK